MDQDLTTWFEPKKLDQDQRDAYDEVQQAILSAALRVQQRCPRGELTDVALRRLKEAGMWASTAIARG
jgi:hypothetical protein